MSAYALFFQKIGGKHTRGAEEGGVRLNDVSVITVTPPLDFFLSTVPLSLLGNTPDYIRKLQAATIRGADKTATRRVRFGGARWPAAG